MLNKIFTNAEAALADVPHGATIMISGFGGAGLPVELIDALLEQGAKDLTIISNNAGSKGAGIAKLVQARRVRKVICSFPRQPGSDIFDQLYREGKIELELLPQGTLAERVRAGGAGIGAFFTPTAAGTELAKNKEVREIDGVQQVLEYALHADYALIKANVSDRWGNLTYRGSARNFGPIMATAGKCTIAQVNCLVQLGDIDPEHVVTPSVFVSRVVLSKQVSF
jgi:3-oxoadipate CoA-transferase alpha subunit